MNKLCDCWISLVRRDEKLQMCLRPQWSLADFNRHMGKFAARDGRVHARCSIEPPYLVLKLDKRGKLGDGSFFIVQSHEGDREEVYMKIKTESLGLPKVLDPIGSYKTAIYSTDSISKIAIRLPRPFLCLCDKHLTLTKSLIGVDQKADDYKSVLREEDDKTTNPMPMPIPSTKLLSRKINDLKSIRGDGRSSGARRYKDVLGLLERDLGPLEKLSFGKLHLAQRAASLTVLVEQLEKDLLTRGERRDDDKLIRATGELRRCLEGLELVQRSPRIR